MRLTRISASNLKGETFQHDLAETVAIVGPNFSGKTAIIEAIRLALLGYLPEVGKLPKASWELSSGPELFVMATFDDESEISRRFFYKGATMSVADHGEGVETSKFADLPLLNAQAYFEMTASERVNYVFSMIKLPESYTADGIIAEIERLSFGEEHTEAIEKAKAKSVMELRDCFSPERSIQEALGVALDTFRDRFTYWNRRAKETQGAVKTLTELKLREKECTADSIRQLDSELDAAQMELDKLNREKGKLVAKEDEAARNLGRKKLVQKELSTEPDYNRQINGLRDEITAAKAKIVPVPDKASWEALRADRSEVAESLLRTHGTVDQLTKRISAIEDQLEGLDNLSACPFCKSKGKHWKENLEKELESDKGTAIAQRSEGHQIIEEQRDKLASLSKKIERIDKDVVANDEHRTKITGWERQLERCLEDQQRSETRRVELKSELDRLNALPDQLSLETELAEVEQKRKEFSEVWQETNVRKKTALNLQQDLKRAAQAQLEHQEADGQMRVIKAVAALVKQKQADMTTEAFTGLLKTANAICGNILKSPLAFHEDTVGRWEGAKFIPHRVFSGMEKKLTYVAIAAALSAQAPLRLMLVDELGLATGTVQGMVMMNLKKAVADGLLDQVIVVIPSDVKIDIPGWQVIWVG